MGPKAVIVEEPAKKPGRRGSRKKQDTTPPPEQKAHVVWDIPAIGQMKSEYTGVYIGEGCVALHVDDKDSAFIPHDYRENNQAVYIMKYKGYDYKLIYSGLNYKLNKCTVYVLIGG